MHKWVLQTAEIIKSFGFTVYAREGNGMYLHYTDGKGYGYVQDDRGYYHIVTEWAPSQKHGAGGSIGSFPALTMDALIRGLFPRDVSWAIRGCGEPYKSLDQFLKVHAWGGGLQEIGADPAEPGMENNMQGTIETTNTEAESQALKEQAQRAQDIADARRLIDWIEASPTIEFNGLYIYTTYHSRDRIFEMAKTMGTYTRREEPSAPMYERIEKVFGSSKLSLEYPKSAVGHKETVVKEVEIWISDMPASVVAETGGDDV